MDRDGIDSLLVLVWGGSVLRLGRLTLESRHPGSYGRFIDVCWTEKRKCHDWILDAVFSHHGLLALTAHNSLCEMPLLRSGTGNLAELGNPKTIPGPKSFLYSGCLSVVQPDSVVVASGTVFGQILVWACDRNSETTQWVPSLKHIFDGHTGSVFGVTISETFDMLGTIRCLLASCSDDRTVKIWDISDCVQIHQRASSGAMAGVTGFGNTNGDDQIHVATEWGHLSRIWGVKFVRGSPNNANQSSFLLSRGEDGACQLWTVNLDASLPATIGKTAILRPESGDRHHLGKNAWSMCKTRDDRRLTVYTGGADGQIISRKFDLVQSSICDHFTLTVPFKHITGSSVALKHYLLLNPGECLATTAQGHLFRLTVTGEKLRWRQISASCLNGGLILCYAEGQAFALIGQQRGGIYALLDGQELIVPVACELDCGMLWMQMAGVYSDNHQVSMAAIVAVLGNKDAIILWVCVRQQSIEVHRTLLKLPSTFTVTACHYDQTARLLVLGSRAGALATYLDPIPESKISDCSHCLRHVHGEDCVTSVSVLQPDEGFRSGAIQETYILTTGRDGAYTIHRLDRPSPANGNQQRMSVVHSASPPFGPNIEGAYFASSRSANSSWRQDLILYGFRSTSFVVWNETQQREVSSVECGGSHRSWSFRHNSLPSSGTDAISFIWTKAGNLNWNQSVGSNHTVIQQGSHGREIKAVAQSHLPFVRAGRYQPDGVLVATGAEDTNIQLAIVGFDEAPSCEQVQDKVSFEGAACLKRHTTGLQHLQFSSSGNHLFSSAGCEEFYVWKLNFQIPRIPVGVVLWDIMPTTEDDSDARIMSFDLHTTNRHGHAEVENHIIAMAYSSGKMKILRYTASAIPNKGTFETLREVSYGVFCLMQTFHLSPTSELSFEPNQMRFLSAGTNGYLNSSIFEDLLRLKHSHEHTTSQPLHPTVSHKVHQSSILAIDVMALDSRTYLVASGGDDNAVGLTLLTTSKDRRCDVNDKSHMPEPAPPPFRTVLIPRAHAAAVTAVKITHLQRSVAGTSAVIITVSNDQRVKIWSIEIDLQKNANKPDATPDVSGPRLLEAVQVKLTGNAWTGAVDVSGMEILGETRTIDGAGGMSILVVGVGMEVLRIAWDGDGNIA